MLPFLRSIAIALASTVIVVIIIAAAALGLARLLLPMAGQYRAEIAQQISASVGRPVTIGALDATWQGMNPYLRLKDVRVLDKEGAHTLLQLADASIGINIPYYVRTGRLERGSLKVSGTTLSVVRHADGSIVIRGFEQHAKGRFTRWLLSQDSLGIGESQVYWTDYQAQGKRLHFTDVNLSLRSNGRRHQVNGALNLADTRGRPVNFALDFKGALTDPVQWSGRFYTQGIGLEIARWINPPMFMGNVLNGGRADFRLWGEWTHGNLQGLQGEVAGQNLRFASTTPGAATLTAVNAQLRWQRAAQGGLLDVTQLIFKQGNTSSSPGRVQVRTFGEVGHPRVDIRFKHLPLQNVSALLLDTGALSPQLREALMAMRPRGELHDLHMQLQTGGEDSAPPDAQPDPNFYLEARVTGLMTQAWKDLPATQNIDALVRADERGGILELDSRLVKLDFATMFRAPININALAGRLSWRHTGQGWQLAADAIHVTNADINASLSGTVDLSAEHTSPFLNLRIGFENGNIANIDNYLPLNRIPPKALNWLERSLIDGRVPTGSILIHGRASEFPFKSNQGSFEARFNVIGGTIDYQPDWPPARDIDVSIVFRSQGMEADATHGVIFGTEILQTHAAIPDLTGQEPQLLLQGRLRGSTTDVLRFLKEGPLQQKFVDYVSAFNASGQSVVDLDLLIALKKGKNNVTGKLEMIDSTLRYADEKTSQKIVLDNINGALSFTETSFTGKDIAATLNGQALRLNVGNSSGEPGTDTALSIGAQGKISAAQVVKQVKQAGADTQPTLFDRLEGSTDWSASLDFHANKDADLTLQSDLVGMTVDLPAPLGKSAAEAVPLTIKTAFSNERNKHYAVSYGQRVDALLEVSPAGKTADVTRGALKFGGGQAPALPPLGLAISGSLPRFSLDAWNEVFPASGNNTASGILQKLANLDVKVAVVEAFKQEFTDARIETTKTTTQWKLSVSSDQVAGTVLVPQAADTAWTMDFERLHLAKSKDEGTQDSTLDPSRLPSLQVSSKSFKYGQMELGQLKLETSKRASGMHVDVLELRAPAMNVTGQGDWVNEGGQRVSRFDFEVEGEELGKALGAFGYDTNIAEGKMHIDLTAHWMGAPMDFALARLNGTLAMNIGKGRFLDIDPGAGRVFGLLSIQALPRRLSLDFSDLFKKGFAFDSIVSEFALKDGNAYTNNLLMKGPSAIISVTGRTGLAAKDYDQMVMVKPQIGASLPLAATLAGGPVAGAAVFLAQKIFQSQIDDITAYQYTIKGSWKDPDIKRVTSQASSGNP